MSEWTASAADGHDGVTVLPYTFTRSDDEQPRRATPRAGQRCRGAESMQWMWMWSFYPVLGSIPGTAGVLAPFRCSSSNGVRRRRRALRAET